MDISKFKEFVQSILKNYSSLLVPAAIGLAAVVVFIPTQLMSGRLRSEVKQKSVGTGAKVKQLNKSVVSREQPEAEEYFQKRLRNEANDVWLSAERTTQRSLLSYEIFPEPKDQSAFIFNNFGKEFRNGVANLLARANAGDCPSEIEMERALQGLSSRSVRKSRYDRIGGIGMTSSRLKEAKETIIDALCRDKAETATVYANPEDVSGYEFWQGYEHPGREEAVQDCWYWQLAYWIAEDVVDTIRISNSKSRSESALTSPVKRLVSVSFGRVVKREKAAPGSKSVDRGTVERPKYVLSLEDALAWPHTGRYCTKDTDVVHFNVVVVVSSEWILPFMQELCGVKEHKFSGWHNDNQEQVFRHNQITILDSKVQAIDPEHIEHEYYRYGQDAVVELSLICEYIFNAAAYEEVKPKAVTEAMKKKIEEMEAAKAKLDRTKKRKERTKKGKTEAVEKGGIRRRGLPEMDI